MEYSRRRFLGVGLKVGFMVGLGLVAGSLPQPDFSREQDEDELKADEKLPEEDPQPLVETQAPEPIDYLYNNGLDVEQALLFNRSIQRNIELYKPLAPKPPDTLKKLKALAQEALPYFQIEGISDTAYKPLKDDDLKAVFFQGSLHFEHLANATSCIWGETRIEVNKRLFNQYSPWYQRRDLASIIIHELAHREGICQIFNPEDEPAAQLAAVEVMAAMTWQMNKYTLLPFMIEVETFSDYYLLYHALKEDRLDWYKQEVVEALPNPTWARIQFDKDVANWQKDDFKNAIRTLDRYGSKPYIYLVEAINNDETRTRELPFPNSRKAIIMDDTKSLLSNLNKFIADLPPRLTSS